MPIYEFHCNNCERESEILVRSSRWKGSKCPHCGSTKLSKKLSVFASSGTDSGAGDAPACASGQGSCGCCCGGGKHHH
jgi:putative FmdB family regulatory protein